MPPTPHAPPRLLPARMHTGSGFCGRAPVAAGSVYIPVLIRPAHGTARSPLQGRQRQCARIAARRAGAPARGGARHHTGAPAHSRRATQRRRRAAAARILGRLSEGGSSGTRGQAESVRRARLRTSTVGGARRGRSDAIPCVRWIARARLKQEASGCGILDQSRLYQTAFSGRADGILGEQKLLRCARLAVGPAWRPHGRAVERPVRRWKWGRNVSPCEW